MEVILGKTAGFCYGVKRAVEGAKTEIEKCKNTYCLGEIVHNKQVVENLKKKGMKFIENLEEIKQKDANVIIRAHGVPKNIYKLAKEKNIKIIDYTCPNVLKIHEIADKYSKDGYYIILCGNKNHPENLGTISYCNQNYDVVEKEEEINKIIDKIISNNMNKVLLISQTTYNLEKFKNIEKVLKNQLSKKNIELIVKNTICRATELRQKETEEIAQKVDYMIIIGGKNSSNTKKLYEIAKKHCDNTVCIETVKELEIEKLKKFNKIGIMAGASTPDESIKDVLSSL